MTSAEKMISDEGVWLFKLAERIFGKFKTGEVAAAMAKHIALPSFTIPGDDAFDYRFFFAEGKRSVVLYFGFHYNFSTRSLFVERDFFTFNGLIQFMNQVGSFFQAICDRVFEFANNEDQYDVDYYANGETVFGPGPALLDLLHFYFGVNWQSAFEDISSQPHIQSLKERLIAGKEASRG